MMLNVCNSCKNENKIITVSMLSYSHQRREPFFSVRVFRILRFAKMFGIYTVRRIGELIFVTSNFSHFVKRFVMTTWPIWCTMLFLLFSSRARKLHWFQCACCTHEEIEVQIILSVKLIRKKSRVENWQQKLHLSTGYKADGLFQK